MTFCLMLPLTVVGVVAAGFLAPFLYGAVCRAIGSMRTRLPSLAPVMRRVVPAAAAVAVVALVGSGLAYGWSEAKPCGGSANAALSAPAARLLACR